MSTTPEPEAITNDEALHFYEGALRRAQRISLVLVAVAFLFTVGIGEWRDVFTLVLGAAVGYINLRWLVSSSTGLLNKVQVLAETAPDTPPAYLPGGAGSVARFLLRYVLLAAAVYVIVNWSVFSVLAFFCGLFLPVGALMIEAALELWVAYRKGF